MLTERNILICATDVNLDKNQLEKIRGYMSPGIDMDFLIDLAEKEGLAEFLYRNLSKAGLLETFNPRQRQRLHGIYHRTLRRNLKLMYGLKTILEPLKHNGIQIVLIQGIAILQQVYKDIGLRPLKDLDLWVLPDEYQNLVASLIDQGFERDSHYPNTFIKDEVVLDIHTDILWVDRIGARYTLLKKRQEKIFTNTVGINFEDRDVLSLNPCDQFLHLGLHAIKRNLKRLLWLVDIKSLVADWKAPDWQALENRAEELGHQRTLVYTLYLLTNIFNLSLPSGILFNLERQRPNFLEKGILDRRVSGHSIPAWARLILISAGRGFRERISFFMKTLFSKLAKFRRFFAHNPRLGV